MRKYNILWILLIANNAIASTPCDYDYKINSEYTKTIESTKNFNRKVFPYIEDARKCVVSMEIKIDNKWYDTNGMFTFGPDMSENEACKNAEKRAKEKIIRKVSPEVLTAKTNMVCKQEKTEIVKKNKESVPILGTVVSEKVIYEKPKIIYVHPKTPIWIPDNPSSWGKNTNGPKFTIKLDNILGLLLN